MHCCLLCWTIYKVAKKHAEGPFTEISGCGLYKNNLRLMEAYLNKEYDYCLFICPKTYGSFIDLARALEMAIGARGNTAIISETILENVGIQLFLELHICT